jgi:hypothetical protein
MYTKEQAYAEIAKLVNTFRTSETRLKNEAEAQIENNFIRPLFKYLNWNTENDGLTIPEYEFVVQRTNRYGKRPDYIMQLDGQHLLVMDAKQVKLDMHDPRWMNQVYAYAYSTQNLSSSRKIDFAILTDFQEFVALDCTLYAGNPKAVANFRVLDWRYDDYLTQFDTLWQLFERENMRQAAHTRGTDAPAGLWARALSPKKVKANRIPPDKAFLMEMDDDKTGWRVRLAKDMKKHNPEADGALITAAVQLLIDRLVFVKALSDREVEDDYLSKLADTVERDGLAESDTGWFAACRAIFIKLNEFYNGSIFESRPELESVTVSNKVVRAIIHDLQPENSSYNFAVLPVEILGTIYERFLGRVVRTTDKQVKIEDKPEVRKAGGVYYTPQYIVNYIVQNTVGKLLEKCRTPEDVAQLKILDPACGSGSFLLGAYNALIDWYIRYYSDKDRLTKQDRTVVYHDSDGRVRLTAKLKRQILLNNLYGVDIDPQAVEVTRFSLSLKALEDIGQDEVYEERNLFKQSILPDLSQNIKCGNSLIGPDYFTGQMFSDTTELKRVNPFDWEQQFLDGGFDAVIGNPPYIRIQTLQEINPEQVGYLKQHYQAASSGNYDIYVVFVEKGLSLLKERGRLGFILPHKFFNAKYGKSLRGLIAKGKHLAQVVHFGDQQVFDSATTYTTLMFLDKAGNDIFDLVRVKDLEKWRTGEPQTHGEVQATTVTSEEWNFAVGKGAALFERVSKMPVKLVDIANRMAQGIRTSANEVYVLDLVSTSSNLITAHSKQLGRDVKLERKAVSLFLQGREIKPYRILPSGKVVIIPYFVEEGRAKFISENEMKAKSPKTFAYLLENKIYLENRERGRMRGKSWYAYVYPKNIDVMSASKILVPDIADRASFALDETGEYAFTSGYGITLKGNVAESPKYVLGLLNSKVLDFYLKNVSTTMRGGFFRYFTQFIEQLPIRTINFADATDKALHDKMVQLVESMLALHKHKAVAKTQADQELYQRQIEATDHEIDALVYELYGLTPDEIAAVEAVR